MKGYRGCKKPTQLPVYSDGEARHYRCPLSGITPSAVMMMDMYRHYRNGFLPLPGAILDQTHSFIASMNIIIGAIEEVRGRDREEEDA